MIRLHLLPVIVTVALAACDPATESAPPDNDCPDCASISALAAYDANTGGIYKGIIVGRESSGRFQLKAKNGDDVLSMAVKWQRTRTL